jgi:hypothetical protein
MRRIIGLGLAALLLAGAWVMDAPASIDPDVETTTPADPEDQPSTSRFSHCAWAYADLDIDTTLAIASLVETDYRIAFPAAGELTPERDARLAAQASAVIPLSDIRVQGDAPLIVEFDEGPAAVGLVADGDTELAAALCPASIPKVWSLPAGTTDDDAEYIVRLMNPFADAARVEVRATSELGSEALPGLSSLSIPARASRTVLVHEEIPGRATVALSIEQIEGSVIPMAELRTETDIAVWSAIRQSVTWEFPLTGLSGTTADLVLTNDALTEVPFTVDVFGEDGAVGEGPAGTLAGPGTLRIPLDGLSADGDFFGLRVNADAPVAAAVDIRLETAPAITTGAAATASRWLVPGINADPGARFRLWLLNSGLEDVTVTYRPLGPVGPGPESEVLTVPATSVLSIPVTDIGSSALVVDASAAVSLAYSARRGDSIGASEGIAIDG